MDERAARQPQTALGARPAAVLRRRSQPSALATSLHRVSSTDSTWRHLDLVRSVFSKAERDIRDDAFLFPNTDVTLRYYASGMIDAIGNRPADSGHRERLLRVVAEGVDAIIAREGVFRDPKPAGCFVVTRT